MRLIDADALIARWKAAMLHMTTVVDGKHPISIETLIEDVEKFPTIDPESLRPLAVWVDIYDGKYANPRYACSDCGEKALYTFEVDALGHENTVQALSESCPKCGAKMTGAET